MCEFCGNDKDIIFPFQLNKCQRCEGEPSLLVAGLGGLRAPSSRSPISLAWRDWKISKPRNLAKTLFQGRKEGEGGEEGLEQEVNQDVKSNEQEEVGERHERKGVLQGFAYGNLVKAFSRSNGEEQQETTECINRRVNSKEREKSQERGDGHARREKVNLLKVLQIDRLKRGLLKGDRRESDTCSSVESLDEVGQESKGRWNVSALTKRVKSFSKRESEDEGKAEVKDKDGKKGCIDLVSSDKGEETVEERKAETVKTESPKRLFKPHELSTVFSRGRWKHLDDSGGGESDEKSEVNTEDSQEEELPITAQTKWRGLKTRRARRITRGRKVRESMAVMQMIEDSMKITQ